MVVKGGCCYPDLFGDILHTDRRVSFQGEKYRGLDEDMFLRFIADIRKRQGVFVPEYFEILQVVAAQIFSPFLLVIGL